MGGGDDVSFPAMDDTADLFTAPYTTPDVQDAALSTVQSGYGADDLDSVDMDAADDDSIAVSIEELVEKGRNALRGGDEPLAISIWSRVFLIKPTHPEAGHLIEKAKKSLAKSEAEVEELLDKGSERLRRRRP